ncbi:MAG: single-stranded-DNA-specific exonuclease RecJ [Oscillospiraceae bacterium]|jgi:single-stranded-DNA-specific exonuclease|nr:single-stranded-DNA-specific exonuclease RecJ [Oscillospiraceae bacterium]
MQGKQWIMPKTDTQAEKLLVSNGINEYVAKTLIARGFDTPESAADFLDTRLRLDDPMLLKDMDAAVDRLGRALERGEKIAVYGDYDVDGITSVCLLYDWLREKGADCMYYIPHRQEDGYGISRCGIDYLKGEGVSLVITVDTGVTAYDEVEYAKTAGIEFIITDHHESCGRLPASTVVNPCRKDCGYPVKLISGVTVTFLLMLAYDGGDMLENLLERYCDLAALGTIADVMPLTGVNRALVSRGIGIINQNKRLGLRALICEAVGEVKQVNTGVLGYSVAPRINAAGRLGDPRDAVELLLTEDNAVAEKLVKRLCGLNKQRQNIENDIYEEAASLAEGIISREGKQDVLVLSGEGWHQGVIGIVASRLSERYACPVFLIAVRDGIGKGSARSFFGINIYDAMTRISQLFSSWGGHEYAAGFTIDEENIPALSEAVKAVSGELAPTHLNVDIVCEENLPPVESIRELEALEPYGAENCPPLFLIRGVKLSEIVPLGWGRNLRMKAAKGFKTYHAFYYGMDMARMDACDGDTADIVCRVEINGRRGEEALKFIIFEMRLSPDEQEKYRREKELYERLERGEGLSREEALRLFPGKKEFIALLRHLKRNCDENRRVYARLGPMCRNICREEHMETETCVKLLVCMDALREMNRLTYDGRDDSLVITLLEETPINLNDSKIIRRLKEFTEVDCAKDGETGI